MPVHVTAELDQPTVAGLLGGLLPLTVDLGDADHRERWIEIQTPELIEFVPGCGIRIQTAAKLQWTVAGVQIPFTIQSVRLLLSPTIEPGRLNLVITLEDTDLKNVPKMIDRSVVNAINTRLAARPDAIGWSFGKTLALRLPLPAAMAPVERFEMDAGEMSYDIDDRSLRLSLALPMRLARREA